MDDWREWSVWGATFAGLYALTLALIPAVLLSRSSRPSGKVAWILAILGLPVLGGLFYAVFGAGREEKYAAAKRRADAELTGLLPDRDEEDPGDAPPGLLRVWELAGVLAGHPAAGGNAVRIMADSRAALERLVDAVDAAERTVCVQFYTFRPDGIGGRVRDALARAAGRGAEVRLLFDRFGSIGLTDRFLKPLREAGGRAEPFQPRGNGVVDRLRLNLRNHRKIAVLDGGRAFCGGVNVGDEYMNDDPATAPWRDTLAEVRGPAAGRLARVFAQDWLYVTGERLLDRRYYEAPGGPRPSGPDPPDDAWLENVVLRVLDDGPDRRDRAHESVFCAAIHAATDAVELSTGYFVPTDPVDRALQCAARRGVRVRVLHGGPGSPVVTRWAARWGYAGLLDAGVEIYERRDGTLHAKALVVDGRFALLGSPNCDPRSLRLNFEASLVSLDDRFAAVLARQFSDDLPTADRVPAAGWEDRPVPRKLGESAAALFAPVL